MFHVLAIALLASKLGAALQDAGAHLDEDVSALLQTIRVTDNRPSGPPWRMFDQIPLPNLPQMGSELMVPINTTDPVFISCDNRDATQPDVPEDRWRYNVADPEIIPYVVSRDDPKRVDLSVVVFPGGGKRLLANDVEGGGVATWLNDLGISAFVVKYRISSHPDVNMSELQLAEKQDAQRAMRLVRDRAYEFGLNKSRVGAVGFSNGGWVVWSLLATNSESGSLYPRYDEADNQPFLPDFAMLIYGSGGVVPHTLARPPPVFLSVDMLDPCVGDASQFEMYSSLKEYWPLSELHIFAGDKHGYGRCSHRYAVMDNGCFWTTAAAMWLQANVLKAPLPANLWAGELVNLHATNGNDNLGLKRGDQLRPQ